MFTEPPLTLVATGNVPSVLNSQPEPVKSIPKPCAVIVKLPPSSPASVVSSSTTKLYWLTTVGSSVNLIAPPTVSLCW